MEEQQQLIAGLKDNLDSALSLLATAPDPSPIPHSTSSKQTADHEQSTSPSSSSPSEPLNDQGNKDSKGSSEHSHDSNNPNSINRVNKEDEREERLLLFKQLKIMVNDLSLENSKLKNKNLQIQKEYNEYKDNHDEKCTKLHGETHEISENSLADNPSKELSVGPESHVHRTEKYQVGNEVEGLSQHNNNILITTTSHPKTDMIIDSSSTRSPNSNSLYPIHPTPASSRVQSMTSQSDHGYAPKAFSAHSDHVDTSSFPSHVSSSSPRPTTFPASPPPSNDGHAHARDPLSPRYANNLDTLRSANVNMNYPQFPLSTHEGSEYSEQARAHGQTPVKLSQSPVNSVEISHRSRDPAAERPIQPIMITEGSHSQGHEHTESTKQDQPNHLQTEHNLISHHIHSSNDSSRETETGEVESRSDEREQASDHEDQSQESSERGGVSGWIMSWVY